MVRVFDRDLDIGAPDRPQPLDRIGDLLGPRERLPQQREVCVAQGEHEPLLVGEMAVERGRGVLDRRRDPPQRYGLEPFLHEQATSRREDLLTRLGSFSGSTIN